MNKSDYKQQLELAKSHKQELQNLIGTIPNENSKIRKIRAHQGWWRAVVMGLPEGEYFDQKNDTWKKVCNRIFDETTERGINFITPEAQKAAAITIAERTESKRGMIEETRLNFNLLSSQPLCFNFFGELMHNKDLGLQALQTWWPDLTELKRVIFEFAPDERYTDDNSAFDVAFEVCIGDRIGLIGLECKYTDTFSLTEYKKAVYETIYNNSTGFKAEYEEFISKDYNQLFRNQLIAEALMQNSKYDFVKTGLFCYHDDSSAIRIAGKFKEMLSDGQDFRTITYNQFIENLQRLDLSWKEREWTMMLWARYCGFKLSDSSTQ